LGDFNTKNKYSGAMKLVLHLKIANEDKTTNSLLFSTIATFPTVPSFEKSKSSFSGEQPFFLSSLKSLLFINLHLEKLNLIYPLYLNNSAL